MTSPNSLVIAIDGPAGSGKSTVAKALAAQLSLRYLDTGAMYRALALKSVREGVSAEDAPGLATLLLSSTIGFGAGEPPRVLLDGEDVTDQIRSLEIGEVASALSVHGEVRRGMVALQQRIVDAGGVILEGRDTTTVVAPHAPVKIYMTASLEERANRRARELAAKQGEADYVEVRRQMSVRDHRDITRDDSPLQVAEGALVIETGTLTIEQVIERVRSHFGI